MIAFSSQARVAMPITDDRDLASQGLEHLVAFGGTALGDAIGRSVKLLQESARTGGVNVLPPGAKVPPAAIVLLSDGAQNRGRLQPIQAALQAKKLKIPIYTVALGTPTGTIKISDGGFTQIITVPPDPQTLKQIALETGGQFYAAASSAKLNAVYNALASRLSTRHEYTETTYLFLGGAALLLARRGRGAFALLPEAALDPIFSTIASPRAAARCSRRSRTAAADHVDGERVARRLQARTARPCVRRGVVDQVRLLEHDMDVVTGDAPPRRSRAGRASTAPPPRVQRGVVDPDTSVDLLAELAWPPITQISPWNTTRRHRVQLLGQRRAIRPLVPRSGRRRRRSDRVERVEPADRVDLAASSTAARFVRGAGSDACVDHFFAAVSYAKTWRPSTALSFASPLPPITYIVGPSVAPAAALNSRARAAATLHVVLARVEALEEVERPAGVADHAGRDVDLAADLASTPYSCAGAAVGGDHSASPGAAVSVGRLRAVPKTVAAVIRPSASATGEDADSDLRREAGARRVLRGHP